MIFLLSILQHSIQFCTNKQAKTLPIQLRALALLYQAYAQVILLVMMDCDIDRHNWRNLEILTKLLESPLHIKQTEGMFKIHWLKIKRKNNVSTVYFYTSEWAWVKRSSEALRHRTKKVGPDSLLRGVCRPFARWGHMHVWNMINCVCFMMGQVKMVSLQCCRAI